LREIVLDTETTGLEAAAGHRIVEIGCVELQNHIATGRTFHAYVNPERDMPGDALAVHGLTREFLAAQPAFAGVADALLAFIADSPLVIHNAEFDLGFLNAEFRRLARPEIPAARAVDTLALARRKFPGQPANLDALCRRFQIDLADRALHGALKDARLLAAVYLELAGGREPGLDLARVKERVHAPADGARRPRQAPPPTAAEAAAHAAFLGRLKNPVWTA
jgi:DNA polymerase-3 subunit epsilon